MNEIFELGFLQINEIESDNGEFGKQKELEFAVWNYNCDETQFEYLDRETVAALVEKLTQWLEAN